MVVDGRTRNTAAAKRSGVISSLSGGSLKETTTTMRKNNRRKRGGTTGTWLLRMSMSAPVLLALLAVWFSLSQPSVPFRERDGGDENAMAGVKGGGGGGVDARKKGKKHVGENGAASTGAEAINRSFGGGVDGAAGDSTLEAPSSRNDGGAAANTTAAAATFDTSPFFLGRLKGPLSGYVNRPLRPVTGKVEAIALHVSSLPVPEPAEVLLHRAPKPPSPNVILGLARYPTFMDGWRYLVGSLRRNGYDGHIVLGVHPDIPRRERDYLDKMGATYYAVRTANCTIGGGGDKGNLVRGMCSEGLEDLKLEWGRYEMARRWLRDCPTCADGWAMVIDTRDIFFQADPFRSLGRPDLSEHDLLFVEEIATHTNTHPSEPHRAKNLGSSGRYKYHVQPCYGKSEVAADLLVDRPMLCSGTVIGTVRGGIHRFLSVLVNEFRTNNSRGRRCQSPATTDQWTMNHLFYGGKFGFVERTKTLPWGTGPVLTVGTACVNSGLRAEGKKGGEIASQIDMMVFHNETGLILNPHETDDGKNLDRVAPTLHQWDRCNKWIRPWFGKHTDLYVGAVRPEDEAPVPWVANAAAAEAR